MSSVPDSRLPAAPGRSRGPYPPWIETLLIVLIAAAAVYLITNHWLHILDALPYLGVVLVMSFCMFGHGGHGGHGSSTHQGPGGGGGHVH